MRSEYAAISGGSPSVLHVSTHDTRGGASLSTYRLHRGMVEHGLNSKLYVLYKHSNDATVFQAPRTANWVPRARRQLRRWWIRRDFRKYERSLPREHEIFSDDRTPWGRDIWQGIPQCEVVMLHWVSGFVDFECFFGTMNPLVPVVWRLADMNPMTGGCHFDWGCGRFASGCGTCPQLNSVQQNDLSSAIWNRKKRALGDRSMDIVCANQWMASQVATSGLFGSAQVSVIPNGVDCDTFSPGDKRRVRESLGIPTSAKVIMFTAANCNNVRKGMRDMLSLVELIDDPNLFLVIVGRGDVSARIRASNKAFGYVGEADQLAHLYQTADLFVIPSMEDNMPNTCLEAMASGTPVVGYATGGIPEMVEDGRSGMLVAKGDFRALSGAVTTLLSNPKLRRSMALASRSVVLSKFRRELQVQKYQQLLLEITERTRYQRIENVSGL